ncbi:MAG: class II fructose-bisphosphate aldolase [Chloroflexi bacterium]|nr:MAG: class II fructose-bisphosphate aldolase [Chloroflexota bacterium]
MTLASGRDLLIAAEAGNYAIPGFNVSNIELALGVIDAANAHGAPILLQFNQSNLDHIGGMHAAAALGRALAAEATVPVGVHLDHGASVAMVRAAAQAGFTSLMFDGSTTPLDANLRGTLEAVAIGMEFGLAVEAELGHVGGREPGVATSESVMTDPASAKRFVEETRVDSLAVSVGTAHGMAGAVRFDLIAELREATHGLPLVLHGGSGVTPSDLTESVRAGIRKVNISTEIHSAFVRGLTSGDGPRGNDPRPALRAARAAVAEAAAQRIELLGAARRA